MKAWLRTASITILLALTTSGAIFGQTGHFIVVDCNMFYMNGDCCATGQTPRGCPVPPDYPNGYTTCALITGEGGAPPIFPNNTCDVDPEFCGDPFDQMDPDFSIVAGGNATHLGGGPVGVVYDDPFFTQTTYVGAVGPCEDEDPHWYRPWTYWSPDGAGRTDIPPGPPTVVSGNIAANTAWTIGDSPILLQGTVRVLDGATLTIDPGVAVLGEQATAGTLIIEQGGQINAVGTPEEPIVFTSDALPGQQDRGQWGGVVLNGRAPVNCAPAPGGTCEGEGGSGTFGGSDPDDSSGIMRYCRIEFAGIEFSPDNELNELTQNGVGAGTVIEYVQTHRGFDDGMEWFGGTNTVKYCVSDESGDDHVDWQIGWQGKAQFIIVRQSDDVSTVDRGIEADNNEFNETAEPYSEPKLANLTFVGTGTASSAGGQGIELRRGTAGHVINSIIFNFRRQGIRLSETDPVITTTFANCPGDPCVLLRDVIGIGDTSPSPARPLFAEAYPNPFSSSTRISLALPTTTNARVAIYDASGRLVDNVVSGRLSSGDHSFDWSAPTGAPAGAYYYRVEAAGQVATGKMHLIK